MNRAVILLITLLSVSACLESRKESTAEHYTKEIISNATNTISNLAKPYDERDEIYANDKSKQELNVIHKVQPKYPKNALRQGYEGFVTYKVDLDKYGAIESIKIAKTSGYGMLDDAALKAIKSSVYVPQNILVARASTVYITCGFQNKLAMCGY